MKEEKEPLKSLPKATSILFKEEIEKLLISGKPVHRIWKEHFEGRITEDKLFGIIRDIKTEWLSRKDDIEKQRQLRIEQLDEAIYKAELRGDWKNYTTLIGIRAKIEGLNSHNITTTEEIVWKATFNE